MAKTVATLDGLFSDALGGLRLGLERPNIYGYVPYPEQEAFHRNEKIGRYLAGGNRGGKTDAMVAEMVYVAIDEHPFFKRPESWGTGPLQLRCFVVDVKKGVDQILIPKLKRYIPTSFLIEGDWEKSWDTQGLVLTLTNGTTIDFLTYGMGLEKMGGVPRHMIFFDEEPPQHIFTESLMRLIDFRGRWVIAATPVEGIGWTYDLLWEPGINRPENPRSPGCFTLSAAKNPHLKTAREDFSLYSVGMDEEEQKMRFEGEFVARSGRIFPDFSSELHCVDPEDYFPKGIPPENWRWYSSVDHGLNNPTAWLWHAVSPRGDIITFAEHYQREMTVPEHARVVHEIERVLGRVPDYRTGDPAMKQRSGITGTNVLQAYSDEGLHIGVEGIPHETKIGIGIMRTYFKPLRTGSYWGPGRPKWVIAYACTNFIKELLKLRYASYEGQKANYDKNKLEEVHKKDDHAFDSARYFATLMPNPSPPEPTMYNPSFGIGGRGYAELVAEEVSRGNWQTEMVTDDDYLD
jgi:phage terminase large subunit-like protein